MRHGLHQDRRLAGAGVGALRRQSWHGHGRRILTAPKWLPVRSSSPAALDPGLSGSVSTRLVAPSQVLLFWRRQLRYAEAGPDQNQPGPAAGAGADCTLAGPVLCLCSSTVGRRGPSCPPGYVRRSEDRLSEPRSRPRAGAGLARRPVGCGRCGALRGHGASSPMRSAENLSSR